MIFNFSKVIVKEKVVKKLKNFYLWIFRDDIKEEPGNKKVQIVRIFGEDNSYIGWGYYNPYSYIRARILDYSNLSLPNKDFWERKIDSAIVFRNNYFKKFQAFRLIYSEGDFIPGLILDKYKDYLVIQIRTRGIEIFKNLIVEILKEKLNPKGIYERSDFDFRYREKLEPLKQKIWGEIPENLVIEEHNIKYLVDIKNGQKTGFYLDQKQAKIELLNLVKELYNQQEKIKILDLFSYEGGLSLPLLAYFKNSELYAVDIDNYVLQLFEENIKLNNIEISRVNLIQSDANEVLKELEESGDKFDIIIIDPPSLIKRKEDIPKGRKIFINLLMKCLKLLKNQGIIFVTSCAYHISRSLLEESIRIAAFESNKKIRILKEVYQDLRDHPWSLQMPETLYLKGFIFQTV